MPHRAVKIVATVGPASSEPEILEQLIQAGVNVFRFNYAHGTRAGHATVIKQVHDLALKLNKPIGTLADISGPKIRLGKIPGDTVTLTQGMLVSLCSPEVEQIGLPVQLANFAEHVQPGDPIYLSDGTRKLIVTEINDGIVKAIVANGGEVSSFKGINLPFLRKNLPTVGDKDLQDIESALKDGIDWIGLSFVSSPEDLNPIHDLMEKINLRRPVLAKLERRQAMDHLEKIVEAFDGVMVARGDLGIEVEFEKVPVIQDRILRTAHQCGKPAIVATQILTSMVANPRPTRAEVTDIAYAVKSGADALMLSEETAIGA
ncbi:MAG: pyruvate kinase, partial [bacterium]